MYDRAIKFFASVLAHEIMHSVIAQHQGTTVKSITLFIFGGVSEIAGEPKKASDEFSMAIAGSLTQQAEFDFRYNRRSALGIEDTERTDDLLAGARGKRLTYRRIGEARHA